MIFDHLTLYAYVSFTPVPGHLQPPVPLSLPQLQRSKAVKMMYLWGNALQVEVRREGGEVVDESLNHGGQKTW